MYIEPNTTIKLYHNLPLDNSYDDTLYFESSAKQREFFHDPTSAFLKYTLARNSYQRVNRGVMRIALKADNVYDCNYLAFQNENFGNKWFYAFITSVEYVNNEACEVTFEIDVMQTYMFDVQLRNCFIERQHSTTDEVGDNIVPENLEIGDYYYGPMQQTNMFDNWTFAYMSNYFFADYLSPPAEWNGAERVTGNYNALKTYTFYNADSSEEALLTAIQHDLQIINDKGADQLIGLYMIPSYFVEYGGTYDPDKIRQSLPKDSEGFLGNLGIKPQTLGDYGVPTNKKLLTYPYNKLRVTTMGGDERDYAYEYFDRDVITYKVFPNLSVNCSFKWCPNNYKNQETNYNESVLLTDIPLTAYSIDAYRAWIAQNKTRLAIQGVTGVASSIVPYKTANRMIGEGLDMMSKGMNPSNINTNLIDKGASTMWRGSDLRERAMISGASSVLGVVSDMASAKASLGHPVQGSADGSLEIGMGIKDFNAQQMFINPTIAKRIDDYFTMFGYAQNIIGIPNKHARKSFTYVKTLGCIARGKCPADDVRKVCAIYDKGIRFWVNAFDVGNYNVDNGVLDNPLDE